MRPINARYHLNCTNENRRPSWAPAVSLLDLPPCPAECFSMNQPTNVPSTCPLIFRFLIGGSGLAVMVAPVWMSPPT
jgi:hypothetical protein